MTKQSNHIQNPPSGKEKPQVYSISQDKDGSFHFSRRDFIYLGAAVGGTLLVRGVCPRFGTKPTPTEPVQAGMVGLSRVYIHAEPSIASNILDALQQNDFVRLINDHPDLGWAEVATQNVQHGWVKRSFIDFSRAIRSNSPNFDLSSAQIQDDAQAHPSLAFSVQLSNGDRHPKTITTGMAPTCGEAIQNGDFEAGNVSWVEETTGIIIRNDWPDPYQGSWVAWLGGLDGIERLTQLFHVPAYVQDAQKLEFYLKVTSEDPNVQVNDIFYLRFLDAGGIPICPDIMIANNTTRMDWTYIYVDVTGMTTFADQDIQIQFVAELDGSYATDFVVDMVTYDLTCDATPTPTVSPTPTATNTPIPVYYVYCPIIFRPYTPPPTATPTSTPAPSATPCPSHNPCPSDCSYDCSSDCPSDCTFECIYECTFDCIYDCSYY